MKTRTEKIGQMIDKIQFEIRLSIALQIGNISGHRVTEFSSHFSLVFKIFAMKSEGERPFGKS